MGRVEAPLVRRALGVPGLSRGLRRGRGASGEAADRCMPSLPGAGGVGGGRGAHSPMHSWMA